ncbi:MAG: hypothetical protein EOO11_07910, partial [Chitinophagaceae bacterium]
MRVACSPALLLFFSVLALALAGTGCRTTGAAPRTAVSPDSLRAWISTPDARLLLAPQPAAAVADSAAAETVITLDPAQRFQTMDGFGYTLTGGSATLLRQLDAARRAALLQELFGNGPGS